MSKVLEQLIARGRRERKPTEQRDVAFSLAEISTNAELHEKMVVKGVVKALLTLILKSTDNEALRLSCLCLANAASTPSARLKIVEDGALPPIVEYLKQPDSEADGIARQYIAMAIGNLAAEPENHEEIVKLGAIEVLVKLLDPEMVHAGAYAAFALANLSVNNEHRHLIVDEGAVPRLIALACCSDRAAQRQSLACLRGICITPSNRVLVVKEGMLDPLVLMARSEERDLQREVAAAFCTLSGSRENKMEISDRALLTIISMSLSGDATVEEMACSTLANLMEMHELHDKLLRENGLASILALAVCHDLNTRGEACRCLANLTADENVQPALMREGVLQPLANALVLQSHYLCQRYAALSLANLSTTASYQVQIVSLGTIAPLIALAQAFDRELEARRYAVLALANLAAMKANHAALLEAGCLLALFSLASTADALSQYYVAFALANLASNEQNHTRMVEEGGLQPIITLASSEDTDVHHQAIAAIRGLSVSETNKVKILQEGGLEPLVLLLQPTASSQSGDLEILREVCAALCNLSMSEETKYEIAKSGAVPPLIAQAQYEDMELARQACATLANLAEVEENQEKICVDGGVQPLISMMRSPFVEVQREAGRALGNLSAFPRNHDVIVDHGGHQLLISYLLSPDMASQRVGALGICNLSTNRDMRVLLMESGAMEPLMSLARSEDVELEIQRFAILAIANLASCVENHAAIVAEGSLPLLISLSSAPDEDVRQYAAFALVKVALNADLRKQITEEGGLEPVLFLARTQQQPHATATTTSSSSNSSTGGMGSLRNDIHQDILPALCTLSFADANKAEICKSGGLPPLMAALTASQRTRGGSSDGDLSSLDVGMQRQACCALANLAESIENQSHLVANGAIPALVEALVGGHIIVQREAARALGNLAANCDYAALILRKGAMPALIQLLGSEVVDCQRMAAMALSNLATNLENQPKMVAPQASQQPAELTSNHNTSNNPTTTSAASTIDNGVLTPVLARIEDALDPRSDADNDVTRYCLLLLANLAVSSDNHTALMTRALHLLAGYARHRDVKCRQFAIFALGNLCSNPDNTERLVHDGKCLPSVISCAFPGDPNVQFQAIAALRGLSVHRLVRQQIVRLGALEPLILAAASESVEVQREVAATFCNLSLSEDNKLTMTRGGCLPPLLALASSRDPARARHAVCALANLAEMIEGHTHKKMLDEGVLTPLYALAASPDEEMEVRRQVARCLALFAAKPASQATLLRSHALRYLTAFTQQQDDVACRRFGTLAIGNLAVDPTNHRALFDQGAVAALMTVDQNARDVETRRALAFALNNLAANEANGALVSKMGVLRTVIALLHDTDEDTHLQACFALRRMAMDPKNRTQAVTFGALKPLLRLVAPSGSSSFSSSSSSSKASSSATTPSASTATTPRGSHANPSQGSRGDGESSVEVQREVCAALRNVSLSEDNKVVMVLQGALAPLVAALHAGDAEVAHQACGVLANLAEVVENQGRMLKEGVLQHLKFVLQRTATTATGGKSADVQREALRAMGNMAAEYAYTAEMVSAGVLTPLLVALSSPDFLSRRFAAMAMANLSTNVTNLTKMAQDGVIPLLVALASGESVDIDGHEGGDDDADAESPGVVDLDTQRYALNALTNLASIRATQAQLVERGMLPLCVRLLAHPDASLRTAAAFGLANFTAFPENHALLMATTIPTNDNNTDSNRDQDGDVVDALLRLASSQDRQCQYRAVCALRGLCVNEVARHEVVRRGGLVPLLALTKSQDMDVQQEVLACLCNLSLSGCIGAHADVFVDALAMTSLVSFLCSADATYRLFGAVTLGNLAGGSGATAMTTTTATATAMGPSHASDHDHVSYRHQEAMVAAGAVAPLVELANSVDAETHRCIAFALCNLAANPSRRDLVVELGGITPIIQLACSENREDQRTAIAALRGLSNRTEARRAIVENGGLEPLVLAVTQSPSSSLLSPFVMATTSALQEEVVALHREVAMTAYNLSLTEANKLAIAQSPLLGALITLMLTRDRDTACFACASVANVAENSDTHARIAGERGLRFFTQFHEQQAPPAVAREALRCLANLASNYALHDALLVDNAQELVVGALAHRNDAGTRLFAALALANFVSNPETHSRVLREPVVAPLIALIADTEPRHAAPRKFALLALGSLLAAGSPAPGASAVVMGLAGDDGDVGDDDDDDDKMSLANAVGVLPVGLATATAFVEQGMLTPLVAALHQSLDIEMRFHAAFALGKLAMRADYHERIAQCGRSIKALITLALTKDALHKNDTDEMALDAVLEAEQEEEEEEGDEQQPREARVSLPLRRQEDSTGDDKDTRQSKYSGNPQENGESVEDDGDDDHATHALAVSAQCQAVSVLRRLSALDVNRMEMMRLHGDALLRALRRCASQSSLESQREAAACLCHLTLTTRNQVPVAHDAKLLLVVMQLCVSADMEVARYACGAVANMAEDADTHTAMVDARAIHVAVRAMRSRHLPVYREASRIVANLMSTPELHGPLVQDAASSNSTTTGITKEPHSTSANSSTSSSSSSGVGVGGGLAALLRVAKIQDHECQYNTALTLHKLSASASAETHVALLDGGAVPVLHALLTVPALDVQRQAASALVALCALAANKPALVAAGTVMAMMSLLRSPDRALQCLGAAASRHLALHAPVKLLFVREGGLAPAYQCCLVEDDGLRVQIAGLLATLSENVHNQVEMVRSPPVVATASQSQRPSSGDSTAAATATGGGGGSLGMAALIALAGAGQHDAEIAQHTSRTLANLSSNAENHLGIFHAAACRALFALAYVSASASVSTSAPSRASAFASASGSSEQAAQDEEVMPRHELCGRDAAMCMGNLAVTGANQLLLVEQGGLAPLTMLLQSRFSSNRQYAARALYRLAALIANQERIVDAGALAPLVALLHAHEPADTQRVAAMALCNLASHPRNEQAIMKARALAPLVALLRQGQRSDATATDTECAKYACMTLCNLTATPANQLLLARQPDALDALVDLAGASDPEGARYAGMTLANVSAHRQNRVAVVEREALRPLRGLSLSPALECQRSAALAIYNVSCAQVNQTRLVEAGLVPSLIALVGTRDGDCKRFAVMTLCNLAANVDTRTTASRGGGLQALIVAAKDPVDASLRRYATIALCNLACDALLQVQVLVHGGLTALLAEAAPEASVESQRFAIMALSNLAVNEANHEHLLARGVLTDALRLAQAADADLRQYAAFALANLAGNAAHGAVLGEQGAVPALLALAHAEDANAHTLAISALRRLCQFSPHNRGRLVRGGGLVPLALAGQSEELETQREVAATLCNVSLSDEFKVEVVAQGALTPLVRLAQSPDGEVARQACGALANLAEHVDTHDAFVAAQSGRFLVALLQHRDVSIHREAARTVANLLSSFQHHDALLMGDSSSSTASAGTGGLAGLVHLGLSLDAECQYNAALAFRKLAPNFASHRALFYEGALRTLLVLLQSRERNTRRQTVLALRDLAANHEFKRQYLTEGGVPALVAFVRDSSETVLLAPAVAALRHLAMHPAIKQPMVDEGVLRPLLKTLQTALQATGTTASAGSPKRAMSSSSPAKASANSSGDSTNDRAVSTSSTHTQGESPSSASVAVAPSSVLDLQCQCAGLVANLTEHVGNQTRIVAEGLTPALVALGTNPTLVAAAEIQQDVSRALANLCANEETHTTLYQQGALTCLLSLTDARDDVTQRYAAMGLRFLASNPQIRVHIVQDALLPPFVRLAQSPLVDYQRTAASAFASFSLHEANKLKLVRDGALTQMLRGCLREDLEVRRDCMFALANVADAQALHGDVVREGALGVMVQVGLRDADARVQRDCARVLASLSITASLQTELVRQQALPTLFKLTRSLDNATQRFATLALCNVSSSSSGEDKAAVVEQGAIRPLTHLLRFPDAEIQRYAALAMAALALGDHARNKLRLIEDGAVAPLVDLLRYPSADVQLCGALALNALVLGTRSVPKVAVMQGGALLPLLALLSSSELECVRCALYCLGSMGESRDVLLKLVELGTIPQVVAQSRRVDAELQRACGYVLALLVAQQTDYHDDVVREGGLDAVVALACVEDMECQEYATFALAHLAANREYQVMLVDHGALRPLIAMMSVHAEPRHYAGLALLKLADNYENHLRIAEEGGIQALLRIARARSTDEELQYKASLSLGQLASNATRSLPHQGRLGMAAATAGGNAGESIGAGVAKMAQISESIAAKRAKEATTNYLDEKIAHQRERRASGRGGSGATQ